MKLINIKKTQQNRVRTYYVYYPDKLPLIWQYFFELFYLPISKNQDTCFLIVSSQKRSFHLGWQQKILPTQPLTTTLYLQNKYNYSSRPFLFPLTLISILVLSTFLSAYFLIYNLLRCFPSPEVYFSQNQTVCQNIKNRYILLFLIHYPSPAWRQYHQDLILRKLLIQELNPQNFIRDIYQADWLYSHHIQHHPLYTSYLQSLSQQFISFNPLFTPGPVQNINYHFYLSPPGFKGTISIDFTHLPASPYLLSLPTGIKLSHLSTTYGVFPLSSYILNKSILSVDLTSLPSRPFTLTLHLESTPTEHLSEYKFLFDLPINQKLDNHYLYLNYPPQLQLTLSPLPSVAQPGYIQYNLAPQGLTPIKILYDQTPP